MEVEHLGRNKKKSKGKTIFLITLLALVCIGGTELLVCRFADPALYARITAPIRDGVDRLSGALRTLSHSFLPPDPTELPAPLEDQSAGDPAIWRNLDNADPAITRLEQRDGLEILTGGTAEIVYYNQGDTTWYEESYGHDTIGKYGCGPTAMSMAVSSLTDTQIDPAQMAEWAALQGYCASGSGSYLSIVEGTALAYGLTAESCPIFEPDHLRQELATGKIGVALVTKGHFTNRGHFILLRGSTLDGEILVADPNSRERSLVLWDAQLILDELSPSRTNGAPLWFLSAPTMSNAAN